MTDKPMTPERLEKCIQMLRHYHTHQGVLSCWGWVEEMEREIRRCWRERGHCNWRAVKEGGAMTREPSEQHAKCSASDKADLMRPVKEAQEKLGMTEPITDEELEVLDDNQWQLDEKPSQVVDRLIAEVQELRYRLTLERSAHETTRKLLGELRSEVKELRAENERLTEKTKQSVLWGHKYKGQADRYRKALESITYNIAEVAHDIATKALEE